MLTKTQWIAIAFLVGLPFAILTLLSLYNPGYMANFWDLSGFIIAPNVVIGLAVVNQLLLFFGFRSNNKVQAKRKPDEPLKWGWRDIALMMLSLILFTLPSLWLVFLYPAVVTVMQEGM